MLNVLHAISIVKPNEPDSYNEDAISHNETLQIFGVSDGAGGEGIGADKWAKFLLEKLPAEPLKNAEAINRWIDGIYHTFEAQLLPTLQATALEKYYLQGSLATLSVIWAQQNILHSIMVGDSMLFVYNTATKQLQPMRKNAMLVFDSNPYLININSQLPKEATHYVAHKMCLNEQYIMCSDTLAKLVTCAYYFLNHKQIYKKQKAKIKTPPYKNYLAYAENALQQFATFENFWMQLQTSTPAVLYNWYQQKLLSYDDYSLIILQQT